MTFYFKFNSRRELVYVPQILLWEPELLVFSYRDGAFGELIKVN